MWPSRRSTQRVTCVACGTTVPRGDAREYDKHGDRWDRDGKTFEHLCKACHTDLCHYDRTDLEDLLLSIDAGEHSQELFLARYLAAVEKRYGRIDDSGPDRRR